VSGLRDSNMGGLCLSVYITHTHTHAHTNTKQYGPGIDIFSNRNEYQIYFLGVRAAGA